MLELENISVAYDARAVVKNVSFSLQKGEVGCLLGASGCGKSTILRAICGFEPLQAGQISLRGNVVSSVDATLAAEKRKVALVFQDFALFPHLSVAQNIAFGLHQQTKQQQNQRVTELLKLVGLSDCAERYPHTLSGGQQQRVALCRAIAPKPDVLLLDEPFSSLDSEFRYALARDIRHITQQEQITTVLVTHDQQEAFAFADVIGVMHRGYLDQWGSAYALYHKPRTAYVAGFIGQGAFIAARVIDGPMLETRLGNFDLPLLEQWQLGEQLKLLIRPEYVQPDEQGEFVVMVESRSFQGAHIQYELSLAELPEQRLLSLVSSRYDYRVGQRFRIKIELDNLSAFSV